MYWSSEMEFRIAHILISIPDGATNAEQDEARRRANSTAQQLSDGANFGDLAIAVSDGQNALEKGDLGWRRWSSAPLKRVVVLQGRLAIGPPGRIASNLVSSCPAGLSYKLHRALVSEAGPARSHGIAFW